MTLADTRQIEIAVVGGGPAGAATALRLASAGHEVALFERLPAPRWRASGVYSSPLTRRRLAELGLPRASLDALIRPISAMVVQSARRTSGDGAPNGVELRYEPDHACGLDRVRLERALLDRAAAAGATVHEGAVVRSARLPDSGGRAELEVSDAMGVARWQARLVVGADGPQTLVGRVAGLTVAVRRYRRAGLTLHYADPAAQPAGAPMEARMVIGDGWYCGVAPVPRARVNVGVVVSEQLLRAATGEHVSPRALVSSIVAELPGPPEPWQDAPATDALRVALPLAHRVRAAARRGVVLVGDAAGFVDPLSGEGLHRALVSAELAADAVRAWLRGDRRALEDYDRHLRARYRGKDLISWLLQALLTRPGLLEYALDRLSRRNDLRRTLGLVLADLVPPSRAVAPGFLLRLAAP